MLTETWSYAHLDSPRPYGDRTTYRYALEWLKFCTMVEDWGCGSGYFRLLLPDGMTYHGIDGAPSEWGSAVPVDLSTYRSKVPAILMRHVLEHNRDWRTILDNALASFTERMCLILFVPLTSCPQEIDLGVGAIPELSLPHDALFQRVTPYLKTALSLDTRSQYRRETVLYLDKTC